MSEREKLRKRFCLALGGTLLVALCCFTPLLVVTLGAVGLGLLVPYLDFFLLPALVVLLLLTIISWLRWRRAAD